MGLDIYFTKDKKRTDEIQKKTHQLYEEIRRINTEIKQLEYEEEELQIDQFYYTHNLAIMAGECKSLNVHDGIDQQSLHSILWCMPENTHACDLIEPLKEGLEKLTSNPDYYKQFNPPNGFGDYDSFVNSLRQLLQTCEENPLASVYIDV